MNVLVATDGSKYGRWALNWVARLPLVEPPHVTARMCSMSPHSALRFWSNR